MKVYSAVSQYSPVAISLESLTIRMEVLFLFPLSSHKVTSLHPQSLIAIGAPLQPSGITVPNLIASYCKHLLLYAWSLEGNPGSVRGFTPHPQDWWELMDKYPTHYSSVGLMLRNVLHYLREVLGVIVPQLPITLICSKVNPLLVSFPSMSHFPRTFPELSK